MGKHWLSTGVLTGALILSGAALPTQANAACSFMCGSGGSSSSGGGNEPFVAGPNAGTTSAVTPQLIKNSIDVIALFSHLGQYISQFQGYSSERINYIFNPLNTDASDHFPNATGIAAGEENAALTDKMSAWMSVNYSEAESDFAPAAFESEATAVSVGLDYQLSDFVVIGAMVSYSETDTVSPFNGGGSDNESYTIAPYAAFIIDEMFAIDASLGYTRSDMENTRTIAGVVGRGKQDGETKFFAIGLTGTKWYENVSLSGRVGWNYSDTDNYSYTDTLATTFAATNSQLGQLTVGGRVSYLVDNFMPFVGATYKYDAISDDIITTTPLQPANDNDEVMLQGGVSFFSEGGFSGGLSGNYSVLREDYEAWGVTANIGFRF